MRLLSQSAIGKLSGQSFTKSSMMEILGRQPEHLAGYVQHKKKGSVGLMAITEGLGNVYMDEQGFTPLKGLGTWSFTWDVRIEQTPTIRFTRAATPGAANESFYVYVADRYFHVNDVMGLENNQQLYILAQPERISEGEFKILVQPVDSQLIVADYVAENKTSRYLYNAQAEISETGSVKYDYNVERHINYLMKIRATQQYSSDFAATQDLYFMSDEDIAKQKNGQQFKVFTMNSVEQAVMDHFIKSANSALVHGRTSMSSTTGRSSIVLGDQQEVVVGDGVIAQYEKYAFFVDYTTSLSVRHFQDAIDYISERRGESQGNHITVLCNRKFSRQKADALQNAMGTFTPQNNGTWFWSKDSKEINSMKDAFTPSGRKVNKAMPNEVTVGTTFNSYVYEGNVITFVVDESLTHYNNDRGYAIFIDTGLYEDEKGQTPGIYLHTLKNRALVKGYVTGIGGADGATNGNWSTGIDASSYTVTGWRGVCIRNPFAALIFAENID